MTKRELSALHRAIAEIAMLASDLRDSHTVGKRWGRDKCDQWAKEDYKRLCKLENDLTDMLWKYDQ